MAEGTDLMGQMIQNLEDSGCTKELIHQFVKAHENGEKELQKRLLLNHRKLIRECLHEKQRQIDCLDFLIHKLQLS